MFGQGFNYGFLGGPPCFTDTTDIFKDNSGVALYTLDYDASDSGNATGKFGEAAIFNGSSSEINISGILSGITNTFSFSCWFKVSDSSKSFCVFDDGGASSSNLIQFIPSHSSGNYFISFGTSSNRLTGVRPSSFIDGNWHHMVVTKSSNTLKFYVDNTLISEDTSHTDSVSGLSNAQIGNYSSNFSDGAIDEVRVFDKALDETEVGTLYAETKNTTNTLQILGDTSCIATYPLDGSSTDLSGNYNGTDANIIYRYDGTPTNVEFGVGGQINYGARFNGTSSRIPIPRIDSLTADVTVSGWLNLGNTTTSNRIRFIEINTNANGYAGTLSIYYKPSNGEWQARSGNGTSSNSNVLTHIYTLAQSTWYHVCFTRDDSTNVTKFYVNGALKDTETVSVSSSYPSGATGVIGDLTYSAGLNYNWLGEMDQVRIFSSALDSTKVSTLYAETACVYTSTTDIVNYPTGTTPVAYYKMDNSSEDFAGSNDGTDTNIEYRFGRYGQAAVFNGSSRIGTGITSFTNTFSLSMWLNPSSLPSVSWIFGNWNSTTQDIYILANSSGQVEINFDGQSGGQRAFGSAGDLTLGNWTHFVVSMNSGNYEVYINGNSVGTYSTTNTTFDNGQDFEIGNVPKANSNPSWNGLMDQVRIYDSALSASNVTELYNEKPEVDTSNFKAVLYEGNSSTQYISNVGMDLETNGGLVWLKQRNSAQNHGLFDTVRGVNSFLISNSASNANTRTTDTLSSFDANGFTLTPYSSDAFINYSGRTMVAWCWKGGADAVLNEVGDIDSQVSANTEAGFSIVKYVGTSASGATVGHGLNSAPEIIFLKRTSSTSNWYVYNKDLGTTSVYDNYLLLNSSNATNYSTGVFSPNGVNPSTFIPGNNGVLQGTMIAYCWHSVAGYSKIGSYEGDGTDDFSKQITGLGFDPSFVLTKNVDSGASNWQIVDSRRGNGHNLYPNENYTEDGNSPTVYGTANLITDGFAVRRGTTTASANQVHVNKSGDTYIYMAFK